MTINEAKAIDMVNYLSATGFEPDQITGDIYWFDSPFDATKKKTCKVTRTKNKWYDLGLNKGGDLLDFIQQLKGGTLSDALKELEQYRQENKITPIPATVTSLPEVLSIHEISSLPLIRYRHTRRIPEAIADKYLKEVRYQKGTKIYYALGFKNDAGGYALHAPYFYENSGPESSTWIHHNANELAVFYGCFDFLSYETMLLYQPALRRDYLILNTISYFEQELPKMQTYEQVHLFLPYTTAGDKYTTLAKQINPQQFIDERPLYAGYEDLNDWLMHIGNPPGSAA
jgi:hypothetical protein